MAVTSDGKVDLETDGLREKVGFTDVLHLKISTVVSPFNLHKYTYIKPPTLINDHNNYPKIDKKIIK